ncbi:type VII secretion target [Nocardia cyriacigeorgica]|uniref:WXG100 family type VII secretion target n=1 Tax=Nocardia cyriacigeorgica (strain GUH-2) TaxID=1127134 RepID=H6R0V4_NOCCG|nr:type VII secretion target [Nocardia cyriacigeorgica]MBF6289194.1 hypothetical protein [Nocardia cyriacigeorgica]CCF61728.1 protein of unknown function [Nocardia cyriacigeorgica GUH-2]
MAGDSVTVDVDALRTIASNLKGSAGVVGNKVTDLEANTFGAGQAGQIYGTEGKKVGDALGRLTTWLKNWQGAIEKSGTTMSTNADTYSRTDDDNVKKIKAAGVQL